LSALTHDEICGIYRVKQYIPHLLRCAWSPAFCKKISGAGEFSHRCKIRHQLFGRARLRRGEIKNFGECLRQLICSVRFWIGSRSEEITNIDVTGAPLSGVILPRRQKCLTRSGMHKSKTGKCACLSDPACVPVEGKNQAAC